MNVRLLLLLVLLVVGQASAQDEPVRLEQAFARLDEFVARHIREENVPGLALAVTSRAGLLRIKTYGWADVAARVPVTPETLFEIGSISKSFTSVALLELREEGKFDPQAPVTRYLPWFKVNSKFAPITGHHLMSHTACLPRDRDDIPASRYQATALAERSTGCPPGERFYYSNIGYQVLGYLLEDLSGKSYAEAIRERIFAPLGMAASEPVITHETRKRLAVGYDSLYDDRPGHPSHQLVPATWLEYSGGDGSIAATPADLAAYLRMLLNRGLPARLPDRQAQAGAGPQARVLSEESFNLLTQRAIETTRHGECERTYYGYGLGVGECQGHRLLIHGGGMIGYQAMLLGDLDAGLGVVVFINGPGSSGRVAEFALKVVRAALEGKELPALPEASSPTEVKNAAEYAGIYTGSGKRLRLVAKGERLFLEVERQGTSPCPTPQDCASARVMLERRGRDAFYANHPDFALYLLRFGREGGPLDPTGSQGKKVVEAWYGGEWYTNGNYKGATRFDYPKEWEDYRGHYRASHAWFSNFRVVVRKGKLWLMSPEGGERELVAIGEGEFRVGAEEWSPERIRFDTVIDGQALRAVVSGCAYYRARTP